VCSVDAVALDLRKDANAIILEDDIMSVQIVECRKVDIDMPYIGCVVAANLLRSSLGRSREGGLSREIS